MRPLALALAPLALFVACSSEDSTPNLEAEQDTGTDTSSAPQDSFVLPEDTIPADTGTPAQDTMTEVATETSTPTDTATTMDVAADAAGAEQARCTSHGPRLVWQNGKCFDTQKMLSCAWATAVDNVQRCLPLPHANSLGWKGTTLPAMCELPAVLLGTAEFVETQKEATIILPDGRRWGVQVSTTARPAAGGTWVKYAPGACAVANEEFPVVGPNGMVLSRGAGVAAGDYVAE